MKKITWSSINKAQQSTAANAAKRYESILKQSRMRVLKPANSIEESTKDTIPAWKRGHVNRAANK